MLAIAIAIAIIDGRSDFVGTSESTLQSALFKELLQRIVKGQGRTLSELGELDFGQLDNPDEAERYLEQILLQVPDSTSEEKIDAVVWVVNPATMQERSPFFPRFLDDTAQVEEVFKDIYSVGPKSWLIRFSLR